MTTPKYFKLEEFLRSDTALKSKIDNSPSWEIIQHLHILAIVLDSIRKSYGKRICISSGFRCPALNKKVGGSDTSVHKIGYAVDMTVDGDIDEFYNFLLKWFEDNSENVSYDQLIFEQQGKSRWVHLGLFNNEGNQRKEHFNIVK